MSELWFGNEDATKKRETFCMIAKEMVQDEATGKKSWELLEEAASDVAKNKDLPLRVRAEYAAVSGMAHEASADERKHGSRLAVWIADMCGEEK